MATGLSTLQWPHPAFPRVSLGNAGDEALLKYLPSNCGHLFLPTGPCFGGSPGGLDEELSFRDMG